MRSLRITQAKPNPAGKDRAGSYVPNAQLNGEWADFQNDGTEPFPLGEIELNDIAYQPGCKEPRWRGYQTFTGTLGVGKTVRVHAGQKPESSPDAITVEPGSSGEITHTFTESGTILIGCHEPGHWEAGMKSTIAIT